MGLADPGLVSFRWYNVYQKKIYYYYYFFFRNYFKLKFQGRHTHFNNKKRVLSTIAYDLFRLWISEREKTFSSKCIGTIMRLDKKGRLSIFIY